VDPGATFYGKRHGERDVTTDAASFVGDMVVAVAVKATQHCCAAQKFWKDLIQKLGAAFKLNAPAVLWILVRPFMESGTVRSIDTMLYKAAMTLAFGVSVEAN
jgi:hypothetical protein